MFTKKYLGSSALPDSALLVPYRQETILALTHFDTAEKVSVREEQFLCYKSYGKNRPLLVMNSGIGGDALLVVMDELSALGVKNFFLVQEAWSLTPRIRAGEVRLSSSTRLYSTEQKVSLAHPLPLGPEKAVRSVTVPVAATLLAPVKAAGPAYKECRILNFYDHSFMRFLNHRKLPGASINYIRSRPGEEKEKDGAASFHNAVSYFRRHHC